MRWMLLPVVGLSACVFVFKDTEVDGEDVSEARDVSGFASVELRGSVDVAVALSGAEAVTVEGPEGAVSRVRTWVEEGVLIVDVEPGFSRGLGRVSVTVDAADLHGLSLTGSGNLEADGLVGADVEVSCDGSGDLFATGVQADQAVISLAGSGRIALEGAATEQVILLEGSGDVDAAELIGDVGHVFLSGSGAVDVAVSDALDVQLEGSGSVSYAGDPELDVSGGGSGDVSAR